MSFYRTTCWTLLLLFCTVMLSCSGDTQSATAFKARSRAVALPTDFQITSDPNDQSQPSVAYDAVNHNRYLTVFVDNRNGSQIYGALCVGSDNPGQGQPGNVTSITPAPANFAITTAGGNKAQPKVAFFPNPVDHTQSRYLVVWTDSRNGYGQIYGQLLDDTGAMVGGNFPVSAHVVGGTGTQSVNQNDPDLIYNAVTGKFVVAWIDTTTADSDHIDDLTAPGGQNSLKVGYVPQPYADTNMVRTAEIDPKTSAIGNVTDVSKITDGATDPLLSDCTYKWYVEVNEAHPKLSYNPISGETLTAWSGSTRLVGLKIDVVNVTAQSVMYVETWKSLDLDGALTKIKLHRDPGLGVVKNLTLGNSAASPALAADPNTNRLLVTWEDNSADTGKDILGQLVDLTGFTAYGFTINVSTATGDQTSPVAAYDNVNERFLVAWEDARNQSANLSNIDIYSQFIDPQGNLSGGNSIVTVAPGNQLSPAVAFGDVSFRKFFVVWKDGRALSNSDLYGQMLEFSSAPQLVVTDSNDNPILNGSIDFGNVETGKILDIPIKIRNDGNTQLTIKAVGATNSQTALPVVPYSLLTPIPATINPGTSYSMAVRFAPTAAGSFAGNPADPNSLYKFVIDSNGGTAVLNLSGSGVGVNPLSVTTSSLPDANTNVPYSITLSAAGGVHPYSWSASGLPAGLTINASTGVISGTPTASGSYAFTVTLKDNNNPKAMASTSLALKVGVVSITTTTLKSWTQGVDYGNGTTQSIAASGGTGPYTFTLAGGSLPAGVTLSSSGTFSGAPTASGSFSFSVRATDSLGQATTQNYTMVVNPAPTMLTSSLPVGVVGIPYRQTLQATGGTLPSTWSIASGALPGGLTFDTGTGLISGTPTAAGTYRVTFKLSDSTAMSSSNPVDLQINPVLGISTPTSGTGAPAFAQIGKPYTFTLKGIGGTAPYSWSVVAGSLPEGLSLNQFTGIVSGTPTTAGPYDYRVRLQDTSGSMVEKTFSTTASTQNAAVAITTTTLPTAVQNKSYNSTIGTSGGTGPLTWAITSGSLPAGLTLDAATGAITGTPTATAALTPFTVTVTDANSIKATATFSLAVSATDTLPTDPGTTTTPSSSGGKSGCFIATAAYGSYLDPQVVVLRQFRDKVLLKSVPGTLFVAFYYKHSPPVADFIREHDFLRLLTRWALTPLIWAVKYPLTLLAFPLLWVGARLRRRGLALRREPCHPMSAAE